MVSHCNKLMKLDNMDGKIYLRIQNHFCIQYNIIVPNMLHTTTARGRSRGRGGQLITYYHHLKHEIFNVVLDQFIVELKNRFGERSTRLLRCIACLDPKNSFANFGRDKLSLLNCMMRTSLHMIVRRNNLVINSVTDCDRSRRIRVMICFSCGSMVPNPHSSVSQSLPDRWKTGNVMEK